MNKKIISDFQKMIDVNTPIRYINDYDLVRIDEIMVEIVGNSKVFEWIEMEIAKNREEYGLIKTDLHKQKIEDKKS